MTEHIRLRKTLDAPVTIPALPAGLDITPLWQSRPFALHALLRAAYASGGGSVPDFECWWQGLVEDEEFDPELVIIASAGREPVGLAQCWTSGFVKDLVVAPAYQSQGIGACLLAVAFSRFHQRGIAAVDLKVEAANEQARRFYRRYGLIETA